MALSVDRVRGCSAVGSPSQVLLLQCLKRRDMVWVTLVQHSVSICHLPSSLSE